MSLHETAAFFARYQAAFNALDGDAVADLWAARSGITDTREGCGRLTWWPSDMPMRANHLALCAVYRDMGCARADFEIAAHVPLGINHAFARLRWTLTRADGSVLQCFGTGYNPVRGQHGVRVLLCTAFEEDLPSLRALPPLADLPTPTRNPHAVE